jgi:transcriptional regulator with XRE-family HTH domain
LRPSWSAERANFLTTLFAPLRRVPPRFGGPSGRIPELRYEIVLPFNFFLNNHTLLYRSVKMFGAHRTFYYIYVNIPACWSTGGTQMSIGTRIIQLRNQKGLTQQQLSELTGLAASYLSRIENRRLEPRPHTLSRIAQAMGVTVSEIFQERSTHIGTLQCVITSSGNCVMNMLQSSRGKRAQPVEESYNPHQLQLLRMANYLIQTADKRLLDSLDVLLGALVNAEQNKLLKSAEVCPVVNEQRNPEESPKQ